MELPQQDIEEILLHNRDVIVIVDEAYVDFGGHSALELIKNTTISLWYRPFPSLAPWLACESVLHVQILN